MDRCLDLLATFSTVLTEKEEKENDDEEDEDDKANSRKSKYGNHLTECLTSCAGTVDVISSLKKFDA